MAKDSIEVTITAEDVKSILASKLNISNARQVADIIIGNLCCTEVGLKQTYLALQGIVREIKFKPEQEAFIHPDGIYSWRYNEQDMIDKGFITNGLIPVRIVDIKYYAEYPIEVLWKYLAKDTGELKSERQWVEEKYIHDATDGFLDKVWVLR